MVGFHFAWDLSYFGVADIDILSTPWQVFARSIASMFIFVMGVSLTLSDNRLQQQTGRTAPFTKYLFRGSQIFGLGLIITIATYFFIGRGFVIFGILHLLGLSIVLAYPFLRWSRWVSLVAGLCIIGLGIYVDGVVVFYPWLIWLGVKQFGKAMVDYYPLLPWFGVALLGVFTGYTLYPQGLRGFALPNWTDISLIRGLRFLGQHSLLIYLVHQPVLIGMFFALGYGSF